MRPSHESRWRTAAARQAPRPAQPKLIDAYAQVIDAMLANEPRLRASVIHERLVADHGFAGSYQRVKLYVAARRPVSRLRSAPSGAHGVKSDMQPASEARLRPVRRCVNHGHTVLERRS